ncbi:hypothetical protein DPEC_G00327940 [Dallia pectoralis]|uniref:Uncharacterized protein n=1 Tax=Dallia pectoralis TaxID=75939 RepID=A0ACC2F886_DALPE|nr:hypothetical protein DPEC_G00327940 [Dallia pectoralis]
MMVADPWQSVAALVAVGPRGRLFAPGPGSLPARSTDTLDRPGNAPAPVPLLSRHTGSWIPAECTCACRRRQQQQDHLETGTRGGGPLTPHM